MVRWADWVGQADAEFRAAECLLAGACHAWCCFTCQQAAEKALIGLVDHLAMAQSGHSLRELLNEVGRHVSVPPDVFEAARRLNRYYIPTRYPDAHPSGVPADQYAEADALSAVEDARAVLDFTRTQLPPAV